MANEENLYVWPKQPSHKKVKHHNKRGNVKYEPELTKSQKEMIRDLKGIFCKGRYYSWIIYQGTNPPKKQKQRKIYG
jgi:hypothetical protein